jgi:hydroxymethylbilane synthase
VDRPLTIGAHESGLARIQAERVAEQLRRHRCDYPIHLELLNLRTPSTQALHDDHVAENQNAIRRLHERLRDRDVDVVIHGGFDLRDSLPEDLCVTAVLERQSPYDALLSPRELNLEELGEDAQIGVVQLRARAQLRDQWPDLNLDLIQGDVGTWLTALMDERIDALVAPNAALEQLGLQERVSEIFPPEVLVPAPCSGILLCVTRRADAITHERLFPLHHEGTATEYQAEYALMDALGGRWESPIGALAQRVRSQMTLLGLVASADGMQLIRKGIQADAEDPRAVGETLADLLLDEGAHLLLHAGDGDVQDEIATEMAGLLMGASEWDDAAYDEPSVFDDLDDLDDPL